jgi:hypothetical protein
VDECVSEVSQKIDCSICLKMSLDVKIQLKFLLLSKTSAILLFNLSIFRLELFAGAAIEERLLWLNNIISLSHLLKAEPILFLSLTLY